MNPRRRTLWLVAIAVALLHFAATWAAWGWWDATSLAMKDRMPVWVEIPWFVLSFPIVIPFIETFGKTVTIIHLGLTIDLFLLAEAINSLAWGLALTAMAARTRRRAGTPHGRMRESQP